MRISVESRGSDQLAVRIRDHEVLVDKLRDADGSDLGPTPTELFVASLAACVAYYAELFLRHHSLLTDDFRVECSFSMSSDRPTRVATIDLWVPVPVEFEHKLLEPLQRVLEHCSVHNSLRSAPEVNIRVMEAAAL